MIVCPHDRPRRTDEIDEAVGFAMQAALLWIVGMPPHRVMPSGHIPRRDAWRWEREGDLAAELVVRMEAGHG